MAPGKRSPKTPKVSKKQLTPKITPSPREKTPAKGNACVCNWADCDELMHIFNKSKHPDFAGRCIEIRLTDTANVLNFIDCACKNLGTPISLKNELLQTAKDDSACATQLRSTHTAGGHKKRQRMHIAKHHFKPGLWQMKREHNQKWSWLAPMSEEDATKYNILADNFKRDQVVWYDPNKSNKQSNGKEKKEPTVGEDRLYIKAPCAARKDVWEIAKPRQGLQSETLESKRAAARTTEEWNALVASKDAVIETLRMKLQKSNSDNVEMESQITQLKSQKQSIQQSKDYVTKAGKRRKVQHSEEIANVEVEVQEGAILQEARDIILNAGGLSPNIHTQQRFCLGTILGTKRNNTCVTTSQTRSRQTLTWTLHAEFEDLLDEVCKELLGDEDAPHDDVLITGNATGLERLGLLKTLDCDKDEANEEEISRKEKEIGKALMSNAMEWFKKRKALKLAEEKEKEKGGKKRAPLLSPERLREQHETVLRAGANESGLRKLRQLERHERLHLSYESGKLRKCLLSYFLLAATDDRRKLLRWMGSSMINHDDIAMPTVEELPKIWLRLAKIPEKYKILADKGFADTERDYPWFNLVETPTKLSAAKGYRKSPEHIKRDRPLTSSRFSAETVFHRVYSEDILNGKIPYYLIPLLPYAHSLAHGEANLHQPFRRPGENSLVEDDYWDNKKDYTCKE
eukprot:scaffold2464_cov96-Skeletonema_dohrnii-CCMP3373.AAC.8